MGNITSSTLILYDSKYHDQSVVASRVIIPLLASIYGNEKKESGSSHEHINGDLYAFRILANAPDLTLWETHHNSKFERDNSISLEKLAEGSYFVKGIAPQ